METTVKIEPSANFMKQELREIHRLYGTHRAQGASESHDKFSSTAGAIGSFRSGSYKQGGYVCHEWCSICGKGNVSFKKENKHIKEGIVIFAEQRHCQLSK